MGKRNKLPIGKVVQEHLPMCKATLSHHHYFQGLEGEKYDRRRNNVRNDQIAQL